MKQEQLQREKDYGAGVAIAGGLLRCSLITPGEFRKIKAALIQKHRPVIGMLEGAAVIPVNTADPPRKRGVP